MNNDSLIGKTLPNFELKTSNNDILNLTKPEIIQEIHKSYINAGSNIIGTNTFSANSISQSDYNMEDHIYEINFQRLK